MVQVANLSAKLDARTDRFNAKLRAARGDMRRTQRSFSKSGRGMSLALQNVTRQAGLTRIAIGGLSGVVGAVALNQLRKYGEEWRQIERRLVSIGVTSERAQQNLVNMAIRTRSVVAGTAAAVQRFSKATGDGIEITMRRVETLQKLLAASGATGSERNSVSIQLGQALQSGVLSGDEFRSIRENAPVEFLDALAKAAGITRLELKKFADDQKLTTAVVLEALDELATVADERFSKLAVSGEEAFGILNTGLTFFVGTIDRSLGATDTLNGAIESLGKIAAGSGEEARTMAEALKKVGYFALFVAGNKGIGALNAAFKVGAQDARDSVTALTALNATDQKALGTAKTRLVALQANTKARQLNHAQRLAGNRASIASGKAVTAALALEAKAATTLSAAQAKATLTSVSLATAQVRLSAAARVTAASMAVLNGVMAFFGGPVGLAISAVAALSLFMFSLKSGTERLSDAISNLSENLSSLETVNSTLARDYDALTKAQEALTKATNDGGDAAVDKAARAVAAINSEIEEHKKLRDILIAQAQLNLNEAQRELSEQKEDLGGRVQDQVRERITALYNESRTFKTFIKERIKLYKDSAAIYALNEEGIYALIEAERGLVIAKILAGASTEDLNEVDKALIGTFSEAELKVLALATTLGELKLALDGGTADLDESVLSAAALAVAAFNAKKALAALIAEIPALNTAAKIQDKLRIAAENYKLALDNLANQDLSDSERIARSIELARLFGLAKAEIDGTAKATRDANKELEDYVDKAHIRSLTARNQAHAREVEQYGEIVTALKLAKASQDDFNAAAAAHGQRTEQIDTKFDERDIKGGAVDEELDLASARALLVENGQRALYIEKELNAARARLRLLLPDLIALGLSRAEAEAVLGSELERTKERLETVGEAQQKNQQYADQFADVIVGGFEDAILGAKSFEDALKAVGRELIKIVFRKTITDPLGDALGSALGNVLGSSLGNIFGSPGGSAIPLDKNAFVGLGGLYAHGGTPPVGKVSIVGEEGPELFIPRVSGTIIPNSDLGGDRSLVVNQNFTINALGDGDIDRVLTKRLPQLRQLALSGLGSELGRGGNI